MMNKQADNLVASVQPDLRFCRATGLSEFAECLMEKPAACPYAMPFGYRFLCAHSERSKIVANTKQSRSHGLEHDGSFKRSA